MATDTNPNLSLDFGETENPTLIYREMKTKDVFYERLSCFNTNCRGYNLKSRAAHYGLSVPELKEKLLREYKGSELDQNEIEDISLRTSYAPDFIRQVMTFATYPGFGHKFKLELISCLGKDSSKPEIDVPIFKLEGVYLSSAEIFAERCRLGSALREGPKNDLVDRARPLVTERVQRLGITEEGYYRMTLGLFAPDVPHPCLKECVHVFVNDLPHLALTASEKEEVAKLAKKFGVWSGADKMKKKIGSWDLPKKEAGKARVRRNQPQRVVTESQLQSYEKIMAAMADSSGFVVAKTGIVLAYIYDDPAKFKVYEGTEKDGRVRNVSLTIDKKTWKCPLDILVYMQYGPSRLRAGDILCHLDGDLANNDIQNLINLNIDLMPEAKLVEVPDNAPSVIAGPDKEGQVVTPAHHQMVNTLIEVLQNPRGKLTFEISEDREIKVKSVDGRRLSLTGFGDFEMDMLEKWLRHYYLD